MIPRKVRTARIKLIMSEVFIGVIITYVSALITWFYAWFLKTPDPQRGAPPNREAREGWVVRRMALG